MALHSLVVSDGARIVYRFDGPDDAPVLLLSNSLGTTMALWAPQIAALTTKFRILRYDGRGHGCSSAPPGDYSIARLGQDVVDLIDELGIARMSFCGLSLGGMVGQWLGIHAGARIERLILCNTSAWMGAEGWTARIASVETQGMAAIADAVVARWFTPGFIADAPQAVQAVREGLLTIVPWGYAGCCAAIRDMDLREDIGAIRAPCLVIGGALDQATPPSHSALMTERIAAAASVMLPAAHLSNIECSGDFTAAVLGFLSEAGPSRSTLEATS
ncbi:MAG: 3-oxoadipate enol-lactonase [Caulobacteraceae bacterium]